MASPVRERMKSFIPTGSVHLYLGSRAATTGSRGTNFGEIFGNFACGGVGGDGGVDVLVSFSSGLTGSSDDDDSEA